MTEARKRKGAEKTRPDPFRNRIVGEGMEAPDQLLANPRNWRVHPQHQVDALEGLLSAVGWVQRVIVNRTTGHVVDGHARVALGLRRSEPEVPVLYVELSEAEEQLVLAALDPIAGLAGTDQAMLDGLLADVAGGSAALDDFLAGLKSEEAPTRGLTDPDDAPPIQAREVTRLGDVWLMGRHRVMCGDSTSAADVSRLMNGATAHLLHADPPYGMGKEADGVANDNLYEEKLDAFQLKWWATFRPFLESNASAYIWGNAPELWRLWWRAGLGATERMELRNEIVWDKKSIAGMAAPDMNSYPIASERCLFFQLGNQFVGNVNVDEFPEAWEPVRAYMEGEALAANIKQADLQRICGCRMYGHWFTRAQFTLMPEKHYTALAAAYPGRFTRRWHEVKAEWDKVRSAGREVINGKLDGARSYFDNAHDAMRDVWEFARVVGQERYGHATPKPVAMMERCIVSALPEDGVCVEPFGGTGATLIGCEKTSRICFTMELQPIYCDVIVRRWQAFTGKQATLEADGRTFDEIAVAAAAEA